ncbi:hypothetical protein IW15_17845 [Chryseobacterium soli]|uniref:Uncharacterized protein n=1 Tax=Chryseobacterium soli TaxID=445961 RepID=A0A086A2W3_9FLAO|nr:hypothetical protein [Chryseobacterium soli]KFF11027.1 hypothetical protein IW15_17845 [Chryseobacterium soli]
MKYEVENWNARTVFVFRECLKTFEEFSEIIDRIIKPDYKSRIEITSWTESFTFTKDEMEIYFGNFYEGDAVYSFELLPFGNNDKFGFAKLKLMMDSISNLL